MVRIKSSVARRKRHKKVLKETKGQFGHRSKRFSQAKRSLKKGMAYAFRDRKVKKRLYKAIWIVRISAACQEAGIAYSRFINGLTKAKVAINRKVLADLSISSPATFKQLVKLAKATLTAKMPKQA
ncbi:MAG: 50S ribosomal protein L20 [Candidatus Omnitrophica bacterium]|nr:50S ribosomal protein L20 [Candidatus Omnitrophota bacterium]